VLEIAPAFAGALHRIRARSFDVKVTMREAPEA